MGNLQYLVEAIHKLIDDTYRDFHREEGIQKTSALEKFNGQKLLGKLPTQITMAALELLAITSKEAPRMLRKETPRGECSRSSAGTPSLMLFARPLMRRWRRLELGCWLLGSRIPENIVHVVYISHL
jgi:hypothetical protein